jgi:hypothetical protein
MRLQDVGTATALSARGLSARGVVLKRDDLADARKGTLTERLHELEHATSQGFVLARTVVRGDKHRGEQYAAFVDTLIQDRSAL